MQIDPMTFSEFLLANGDEKLMAYLESVDTFVPIPDAFFNPLYEKLKMYYVTGGMPEPVLMWTKARDVSAMQETLITQFEVSPRYWSQNNPPYEVDFLIQRENDIFPVEVKSETNTSSKSLKKFKELFPDKVKLRVRFSLDNLKLDDDVLQNHLHFLQTLCSLLSVGNL